MGWRQYLYQMQLVGVWLRAMALVDCYEFVNAVSGNKWFGHMSTDKIGKN